jgi:hypothetical protein
MTIQLNPSLSKQLDSGMTDEGGVQLPFPVIYFWAHNGQPNYKSAGGALYYGGWVCKAEEARSVCDEQALPIPAAWQAADVANRDGSEYEAYTARHLVFAPIGKRESWLVDNKRSPHFVDGGRRHVQVLVYLAETIKGEDGVTRFQPWGQAVLTAKGYQAKNLLDALATWEKVTAQIRSKVAPGVPAWCFYLSVGTFGKERQAQQVGKSGAQSPITPVSVYVPERFTEELMQSLFVGEDVATIMAELQGQAGEWLNAWKTETNGSDQAEQPQQHSSNNGGGLTEISDGAPF